MQMFVGTYMTLNIVLTLLTMGYLQLYFWPFTVALVCMWFVTVQYAGCCHGPCYCECSGITCCATDKNRRRSLVFGILFTTILVWFYLNVNLCFATSAFIEYIVCVSLSLFHSRVRAYFLLLTLLVY